MREYRVLTYDTTSNAGNLLTEALGGRSIRPNGSTYRYKSGDKIVRWGLYGERYGLPTHVQQPSAIQCCTSKKASFRKFEASGVPHPNLTKDPRVALGWIQAGGTAYARYDDSGCKGRGIQVCHNSTELARSMPLYWTKGFHIHREFRVYVAFGKAVGIREKIAPKDTDGRDLNPEIRASDDWLYSTNTTAPTGLRDTAIAATKAIGLDFAGIDIASNEGSEFCVFECNSAPWLSQYLAAKIAESIKENCPL